MRIKRPVPAPRAPQADPISASSRAAAEEYRQNPYSDAPHQAWKHPNPDFVKYAAAAATKPALLPEWVPDYDHQLKPVARNESIVYRDLEKAKNAGVITEAELEDSEDEDQPPKPPVFTRSDHIEHRLGQAPRVFSTPLDSKNASFDDMREAFRDQTLAYRALEDKAMLEASEVHSPSTDGSFSPPLTRPFVPRPRKQALSCNPKDVLRRMKTIDAKAKRDNIPLGSTMRRDHVHSTLTKAYAKIRGQDLLDLDPTFSIGAHETVGPLKDSDHPSVKYKPFLDKDRDEAFGQGFDKYLAGQGARYDRDRKLRRDGVLNWRGEPKDWKGYDYPEDAEDADTQEALAAIESFKQPKGDVSSGDEEEDDPRVSVYHKSKCGTKNIFKVKKASKMTRNERLDWHRPGSTGVRINTDAISLAEMKALVNYPAAAMDITASAAINDESGLTKTASTAPTLKTIPRSATYKPQTASTQPHPTPFESGSATTSSVLKRKAVDSDATAAVGPTADAMVEDQDEVADNPSTKPKLKLRNTRARPTTSNQSTLTVSQLAVNPTAAPSDTKRNKRYTVEEKLAVMEAYAKYPTHGPNDGHSGEIMTYFRSQGFDRDWDGVRKQHKTLAGSGVTVDSLKAEIEAANAPTTKKALSRAKKAKGEEG